VQLFLVTSTNIHYFSKSGTLFASFFYFPKNGENSPISRVLGKDFKRESLMERVWQAV
jgi:hypothetical protein